MHRLWLWLLDRVTRPCPSCQSWRGLYAEASAENEQLVRALWVQAATKGRQ